MIGGQLAVVSFPLHTETTAWGVRNKNRGIIGRGVDGINMALRQMRTVVGEPKGAESNPILRTALYSTAAPGVKRKVAAKKPS